MATSHLRTEHDLKTVIHQWNREKLERYAISLTEAMNNSRRKLSELSALYETTHAWLQGLTLVEEIGQHLSATLNLNEVLELLLRRVSEALNVVDGSILFVEEPSGDLVFQTSLGSISEEVKPFRIPKGEGIAGEVAETGIPIRVDNAQEDSRHFKKIDQDTGFLTRSILCVPLRTREKTIGVMEVFNKRTGPFTDQDQLLLSSIANYAAIAIENARLHQSVLAEKDRVLKAQERVSRRLQRDLHDGPTQLVAALEMSIDFCQKALDKDPSLVRAELENMARITKKATHQMRTLLFELRPLVLETQGLVPALKSFVKRRQADDDKTTLHLVIRSDAPTGQITRLKSETESALFAIVQEAVNNALKHAHAENIYIKLTQRGNRLAVTILDDGLGFETKHIIKDYEQRGSYGMVNMKERAELAGGTLSLKSAPGAGTEIRVVVPINQP